MELSRIRPLWKGLRETFDKQDTSDIIHEMQHGIDFIAGDYRFIHEDVIDDILKEELLSDTYMLGCFNDWFIADVCDLGTEVVKKAQVSGSCEILGELMAKNIEEVLEKYISYDGYGNHFAQYDGYEHYEGGFYFFKID